VALVLVGAVPPLGACGGGEDSNQPREEAVVIKTSVSIAATEGAEPIATGEILKGSTLGGTAFCAGGTILDSHASADPAVAELGLIDRAITCPDGSVRMVFTPGEQGLKQPGVWTIVSGTGPFEGLRGSGELEVTYDPTDDTAAHETYTGTATH
jgi:hypothetical protein